MATQASPSDRLFQRIGDYLANWEGLQYEADEKTYWIPWGTTMTVVSTDGGEDYSTIKLSAVLVSDVDDSPGLYRYVATHQPFYGQYEVFTGDRGNKSIRAFIAYPGDYLDEAEFQFIVMTFCGMTCADHDKELMELFGGQRWTDRAR